MTPCKMTGGILPLQFVEGQNADELGLDGSEVITVAPSTSRRADATVRIDTPTEGRYYENGGILQYVLRDLID